MKSWVTLYLITFSSIFLIASLPPEENAVTNGDFELPTNLAVFPDDWGDYKVTGVVRYGDDPQIVFLDTVETHFGHSTIRIERHVDGVDMNNAREVDGPFINVEAGDTIELSGWIKASAGTPVGGGGRISFDYYGYDITDATHTLMLVDVAAGDLGTLFGWGTQNSYVPWGSDWSHRSLTVTVPATITDASANVIVPVAIIPWLQAWGNEVTTGYAWFSDTTLYITPETPETPPVTTGLTFSSLFAVALAQVESHGVDCGVTYQPLELVAADTTTGQYGESYGAENIHMIVGNTDGAFSVLAVGSHNELTQSGYTDTAVAAGGRILDSFGDLWAITAVVPHTVGDVNTHYVATLKHIEESRSAVPVVNPPLPPRYSGIMGITGPFESNSLTEEGNVYGEMAQETLTQTARLLSETVENTLTETGATTALTPSISYIGATNATANNSLGADWTLPAGWAAGDIAIFWWYTYTNTKTVTEPVTVTQLQDSSSSGYGRLFVGWRALEVGDATFAWTSSDVANSDVIWGVSVFRGQHVAPIDAETAPVVFDNSVNPPPHTITTATASAAVFVLFGKRNDYSSIAAPTGLTLCGSGSSTAGADASAGAAYILAVGVGNYGFVQFTLGGGAATDDGYIYSLSIKPA